MNEYQNPDEIEREIEATRERMGRGMDELGDRLTPENLKRQAKDAITSQAREKGFRVMDFIQENTSLVAAMGLGAVWLVKQRNKSEISGDRMARFAYTGPERRSVTGRIADRAAGVRESVSATAGEVAQRASDLSHRAGDRARDLGVRARDQTRRARGGLERLAEDNPLAVAAGVAALGLACGLLVPESERERRLMGPARDDLAHRAQETARRVKDAAVEAGEELRESVRDQVSERAPEVKAVVQDVVQSVGEEVKQKAGRVKEEAKQAAREQRPGRGPSPT
jgi:gas vesicle protein